MTSQGLPLSQTIENDQICDDFESAWERYLQRPEEDRPKLEDYLAEVSGSQRSLLFHDLLELELACRTRRGEDQSQEEYLSRFPDQADTVRELLTHKSGDPQPTEENAVPETIGRYTILARVAMGGFGTVYRAFDDTLRRDVAIKVPHRDRFSHAEDRKAYLSEARILAQLRHPHIVLVHDVAKSDDGQLYVVSQFVDGTNLAERMMKARLDYRESVELISLIADALHYAHGQKLVHRDVKPANILLDAEQRPYLADFGLALTEDDYGRRGRQGGTIAYMSPEQARHEGHLVDGRSDIFSLGAVLYEMLTGVRPFQGENWQEILDRIIRVDARPPRMLDDTIPKELERICLKSLAKKAADRYPVARDMSEDLRHFLDGLRPSGVISSAVVTQDSPTKIIPKGLRSYDAEDADFFLELVPGPRDRHGLPEPIRFWKTRIERTELDETFRIGLVYGPSGCGKSSLIKAGLLPQLADRVVTVFVECTSSDTEARLLRGLRRSCHVEPETNLVDTVTSLRREQRTSADTKVLIILDQFEQWLYARDGRFDGELVQALRQCNGARVQCMLMVRDDFWLAVSRFLDELDVDLLEGENTALVDLFDQRHARKVLAEFGRAYDCLPDDLTKMSVDQEQFLDHVVSDLSQDDKVISVRLSLFAEMVKGKPWTSTTLKEVEGTEGVRVMFLDETFVGPHANPKHRQHQKAARLVLTALVPEAGTDIKGSMRPASELRGISGYADRPRDFAELMRILDRETRLVTPAESTDGESTSEVSGEKSYQLTHDYLVPTLRTWLTREQKKTRRGRAELRLAERTAAWKAKREKRHLPAWWEVLNIWCFTRRKNWTKAQTAMMRTASTRLAVGMCLAMLLVALLGGREIYQSRIRAERRQVEAIEIVERLWSADTSQVPEIVRQLTPFRDNVGVLQVVFRESENDERRVRAGIALLKLDLYDADLDILKDYLLSATPDEVSVLRDALLPHRDHLVDEFWEILEDASSDDEYILPAASALAVCDPISERWKDVQDQVVTALLSVNPVYLGQWVANLRPVRNELIGALTDTYRSDDETHNGNDTQQDLAANALVHYIDEPDQMAELLLDVKPPHFALFYPRLEHLLNGPDADHELTLGVFEKEIAKSLADLATEEKKQLAIRQANAAVALMQMGMMGKTLPLLNHSTDPTARSYFIQRVRLMQSDPKMLIDGLEEKRQTSSQQTLILALGQFDMDLLSKDEQSDLAAKCVEMYESNDDSGIHSAVELLLRRWHLEHEISRIDRKSNIPESLVPANSGNGDRRWFVNQSGQTMIVLTPAKGALIDYPVAFASKELTRSQFEQFLPSFNPPIPMKSTLKSLNDIAPEGSCSILGVNWFEAAAYCNWLNIREGIREDQWCYIFLDANGDPIRGDFEAERFKAFKDTARANETDDADELGEFWQTVEVRLAPDWQQRTGYRLPTTDEWQYACRCQTNTEYYFGSVASAVDLLSSHAWYNGNSPVEYDEGKWNEQSHPVGTLIPNAWGLFDMHGNAWEWCHPADREHTVPIGVADEGELCGGSYTSGADRMTYSERAYDPNVVDGGEVFRDEKNGFRVMRRLP